MNNYEFTENCGIGYTYNNIPFYFDIEDFDKIKQYQWYIKNNGPPDLLHYIQRMENH